MSKIFSIQSHKGPYDVVLLENGHVQIDVKNTHFLVDAQVARLHPDALHDILASDSVLLIDANEENKSLDCMPSYVQHLLKNRVRRDHKLVAIGGGVVQDITCFLASIVLRGLDWWFVPTTLLAQADSCIGSKSSINCAGIKNIVGTFTPPANILISLAFLRTLKEEDVCSGVGEMLKVHAIESPQIFDSIARDYDRLFKDAECMKAYILQSLMLKKKWIEMDEFDRGQRQVMNYGHSFGHAIESATSYAIPHGIAVSIGMDLANYISAKENRVDFAHFMRMHETLKKNYRHSQGSFIPQEAFFEALSNDKKNTGAKQFGLILLNEHSVPHKQIRQDDDVFRSLCSEYFKTVFFPHLQMV